MQKIITAKKLARQIIYVCYNYFTKDLRKTFEIKGEKTMTEQFEALDVYPTLTEEELKSTNGGHRPTETGGGFGSNEGNLINKLPGWHQHLV